MTDTFSTSNRFTRQTEGGNPDTWGQINNTNFDLIDAAMDGELAFALSAPKTLSALDGASDEARCRYINVTGGTGGTITIPAIDKWYIVRNNSSGDVTFTCGVGVTATFPTNSTGVVVCDGSSCRRIGDSTSWREIETKVTTSGTSITFSGYTFERWNELRLIFLGVGHSTVGAQALRIYLTSGGSTMTARTIGSFAGSATLYGDMLIRGHAEFPNAAGVITGAVADLTAIDLGADAGVTFPFRLNSGAISTIVIDFNGATFDAGSIRLSGR